MDRRGVALALLLAMSLSCSIQQCRAIKCSMDTTGNDYVSDPAYAQSRAQNSSRDDYRTCYVYNIKAFRSNNDTRYYIKMDGLTNSDMGACDAGTHVQVVLVETGVKTTWWGANTVSNWRCCDTDWCNFNIPQRATGAPQLPPALMIASAFISVVLAKAFAHN